MPELSVVILCYRSENSAFDFVQKVKNVLELNKIINYELVLVGNYQPNTNDETPEVIKKIVADNSNIIAVTLEKPKGGMMGWDMKSGLNMARGEYIAVIDGDGQMSADDLVKVYNKIKEENLDLVKTYRIKRGYNYWRKTISFVYNIIFKLLFPGLNLRDINSKPKIIKKEILLLLELKENGWCIDAEIMIQARRLNFKTAEIPTDFLAIRRGRKSFVKFTAIFEFIKFLLYYRWQEWFKKKI